jgi:hypothetical protein
MWTLQQAADYVKQGNWPTAGNIQPDPDFEYVTMLLHGDGTNGGQNNTFLDSSTNNFTITRNGNTTQGSFSPYGPNWSNYFDGAGDYLNFGTSSQLTLSGDFTVEGWFFVEDTASTFKRLFNNAPGTTPSGFFYVYTNGTTIRMYNDDAGVLTTVGTFSGNSVWFHFAVCRSGSTTRVFVNGTQTYSYSGTTTFTNSGWYVGGGPDQEYHKGYISNHRVVVGSALYTSNFTPSTTPLTAVTNTRLLTCADNRFVDDSTNNFVPTIVGNTSVQRFSPFVLNNPGYTTATIGGSGYFDGAGDYLNTGTTAALDLDGTNYTIEAWVYLDGTKSTNTLLFADPYYVLGISLSRTGAGDTYIYTGDGASWTGVPLIISSSNLPLRCWSHFALVKTSTTMTIYHNGVNVGSNSQDWRFPSGFNGRMFVGAINDATEFFGGYISGLRITRSALYTSNFTPSTTPLTQSGSLLLNFTNGTIFDNAMMNDLETVGNAQISTSVVKFGTGSLAFDGTGDWLTGNFPTRDLYSFGTGDFTVEMWVYTSNLSNFQTLLDTRATDSQTSWCLFLDNTGKPYWYDASGVQLSSTAISSNTWTHLAVSRSGSTLRMFLSGTQVFSGTNTNSQNPTGPFYVARNTVNAFLYTGYIDDLRITKGVARYTANFTPPTAAFPNF